jgi:hypothetical protein
MTTENVKPSGVVVAMWFRRRVALREAGARQ